jgi:dimethylhistidine N-methyltransferase
MDDHRPRGAGGDAVPEAEADGIEPLAAFYDFHPDLDDFESAVLAGLSQPNKELPCKFFYDEKGSRLFDDICELEEYYPTRAEAAVIEANRQDIVRLIGPPCHLVEFGSGSSVKVRILLNASSSIVAYTPVDISREHLLRSAASVARDFPSIEVIAVCADYTRSFSIPRPRSNPAARRIVFFPGSTVGNFTPSQALDFLARTAKAIGPNGGLLIGVDLKKDVRILNDAYNDNKGVTAAFNLNLLARINRELGANFDLTSFRHLARYNEREGRIEMHLISLRPQAVRVNGTTFTFRRNESIHTECSYKYSIEDFQALARTAGFDPVEAWTDREGLFSVHFFRT